MFQNWIVWQQSCMQSRTIARFAQLAPSRWPQNTRCVGMRLSEALSVMMACALKVTCTSEMCKMTRRGLSLTYRLPHSTNASWNRPQMTSPEALGPSRWMSAASLSWFVPSNGLATNSSTILTQIGLEPSTSVMAWRISKFTLSYSEDEFSTDAKLRGHRRQKWEMSIAMVLIYDYKRLLDTVERNSCQCHPQKWNKIWPFYLAFKKLISYWF